MHEKAYRKGDRSILTVFFFMMQKNANYIFLTINFMDNA